MSSFCSSLTSTQNDQTEKTINGVKVSFPGKPYPSQISMMDKILTGLKRSQSCLLESPTGSGKTLALLCASLAWQKAEIDGGALASGCPPVATEVPNEVGEVEEKVCTDVRIHARIKRTSSNIKDIKEAALLNTNNNVNRADCDEDDEFQTPRNRKASVGTSVGESGIEFNSPALQLQQDLDKGKAGNPDITSPSSANKHATHDEHTGGTNKKNPPETPKVPVIFFGTRTHKQITQVIRELRKTVYANTRMTVLASREHTCIHPVVSKNDHKNENCADLIKNRHGSHCHFYHNSKKRTVMPKPAWDIEDIVNYGKDIKSCPYFMTRDLLEEAQIVFCPYNYLVDPQIRRSMKISLQNQIVILDEAHNIEDTARDAASFSLTAVDLTVAIKDLVDFRDYGGPYRQVEVLKEAMESLSAWILKEAANIREKRNFGEANNVWNGVDMVAALTTMKLGPDTYKDLIAAMKYLNEFAEQSEDPDDDVKLSAFASKLIEGLLIVLEFLYRNELEHMDDYRVALVVTKNFQQNSVRWKPRATQGIDTTWNYTLNFWCLKPSVAFSDISQSARCIVLTSGTLSPMKSFQSELGVNFLVKLEANHVIDPCQAWIGQISYGPTNHHLNGSYKFSETFVYQDEIGNIVHRICTEVPYGILCFFSSYSLLKKIMERWKVTGLYQRLEELKVVLSEPQGSKKDEFSKVLNKFYDSIDPDDSASDISDVCGNVSGALLLAVCRGKVSEGLDFSDNNARAVITVGIPFPSIKDLQVSLKKSYNDANWKKNDLLSGNEWYEIQAFRALNQALGRCIRHRKDWGALILVDSRIGSNESYQNSLSRWVRSKLKLFHSFSDAQGSLRDFIDSRKSQEKCPSNNSICEANKLMSPVCSIYGSSFKNGSAMTPSNVPHSEQSPSSGPSFLATSPDIMSPQTVLRWKTNSPYERRGVARELLPSSNDSPKIQQDNCERIDDANAEDVTTRMDTDVQNGPLSVCSNVVKSLWSKLYQADSKNVTNTGTKKRNPKGASHDATKRKKPFEWEDDPVCRAGVWCTNCGHQLVPSLEYVRVSLESLHITKMADHHEEVKRNHFCECVTTGNCCNHNTFVKNGDVMKENCDRALCNLGCLHNAFWSEEDEMCFQQMQCKSCRTAIGYQVMATRNYGNIQCDQVWLIPRNSAFCLKEKPICATLSTDKLP